MNWQEYTEQFDSILEGSHSETPYNDPTYVNYVKLNKSRQNRWLKQGELIPEMKEALSKINKKQTWILITEPWCGDSAHNAPFIYLMSEFSDFITLDVHLRDAAPFLIEDYLTNGSRGIPKVIVRDDNGKDLFTWGARPQAGQDFFVSIKEAQSIDQAKIQIQDWYNTNKGEATQKEFVELLAKTL